MNLFLRLRKWASKHDENYQTESFVVILQVLLDREPAVGLRIVNILTGGFIDVAPEDVQTVELASQVTTRFGRPDIEIRIPDALAVIEVKCESGLHAGQLEGYREYLRCMNVARKCLILLSRYPAQLGANSELPDFRIRWFEIADVIEGELASENLEDPIGKYLCEQFLAFLQERGMSIAQVSWQLAEGTRALRNFLGMLQEAALACELAPRTKLMLDWMGFTLDGGKYWLGLQPNEPNKLWFQTLCPIDRQAAEQLGEGLVEESESAEGGTSWWREADLESEEVHFFARTKVGQLRWLEIFLADCLAKARQISIKSSSQEQSASN